MDTVIVSWSFENIVTVVLMVALAYLVVVLIAKTVSRVRSNSALKSGS